MRRLDAAFFLWRRGAGGVRRTDWQSVLRTPTIPTPGLVKESGVEPPHSKGPTRMMDLARLIRRLGDLPGQRMIEVDNALRTILAL